MSYKLILFTVLVLLTCGAHSQAIEKRLAIAMKQLTGDTQMKYAIASLTVADASGNSVYRYNNEYGLAPASNMKVFTSIAALDLLGKEYQYKTEMGYSGSVTDSVLTGDLYIVGNGDPTTGSWRYAQTAPDSLMKTITAALRSKGINEIKGQVILDGSKFSSNPVPGEWSWEDMGNYYGAGTWGLNWHENQYDMQIKPGKKVGDETTIIQTDPETANATFINKLTTGEKGSGDNSLIFLPPNNEVAMIEGTIPQGGVFTVSGSLPEPYSPFATALKKGFADYETGCQCSFQTSMDFELQHKSIPHYDSLIGYVYSPTMDSMIYFFLKKSVNLYGEDFIKTIALQQKGYGTTDDGVDLLKRFWTDKGIESAALNIKDGSGLSAGTRVSTGALVKALLYAKSRAWFSTFYDALPIINNMHMKSGTIANTRAFSGYQTASNGKQYVFSLIVNNYNGSTKSVTDKMFDVLNELKK